MPFFSVVIPVFNRSRTILPTLRSVQEQTFMDFECIVIDDGSKDGEELESVIASLDDNRFRYLRRANGGASAARNTGIDIARGDYIAFLDSDDLFLSNKLQTDFHLLKDMENPRAVLFSPVNVDRGLGKHWVLPSRAPRYGEPIADYLIRGRGFTQTSTLVVERTLAALVRFHEGLPMAQDVDFPIRLEQAGAIFAMKTNPTTQWRDIADPDRVSSMPPFEPMLQWTDDMRSTIGERCYYAFRASHIARLAAPRDRALARALLLEGLMRGAMPPKTAAKAAVQVLFPRHLYRSMFDCMVRLRGSPPMGE